MTAMLMLEGVIPTDPAAAQAEVDRLWQVANGNVPEDQWGTTPDQMPALFDDCQAQYGITIGREPVYATTESITAAFNSAPYTFVCEHGLILGPNGENHWLTGLKAATDFKHPPHDFETFVDSARNLDWGPDNYPVEAVVQACQALMGAGNLCGWACTVTKPD